MPSSMRLVHVPRMLRRFESTSGVYSYTFPIVDYEWESTQGLRTPATALIGADYGFDYLGTGQGIREFSEERLRFTLYEPCGPSGIDADVDRLRSNLLLAGLGKGWVMDYNGEMRWAYMRLMSMPTYSLVNLTETSSNRLLAAVADFRRQSDWFAEDLITSSQTVTVTNTQWTVTNPGNLPSTTMTIRLRANSAAGYTNPVITNLTNGYTFSTTRDASSTASEVMLDTRTPAVYFSTTDGVSYTDDFASYTLPAVTQRALSFRLEPGGNIIRLASSGVVNVTVEFSADAPFA